MLGVKVIQDVAPAPSLRGMELRLTVAPGLNGVTDIAGDTEEKGRTFAPTGAWRCNTTGVSHWLDNGLELN